MKYKSFYRLCLLICLLIVLIVTIWHHYMNQSDEPIHIALVGPMTGQSKLIGKSLKQGVSLFIDEINAKGGIHGHPIIVDNYDDQNQTETAVQKAKEIEVHHRAVSVIGHWYSSCSFRAGSIYKKNQIPAITPGSTNVKVTRFNSWYFRTVFNDNLQGRFLANYSKKVLKQNIISIIYDNDPYGSYLATVFEAKAKQLGITIPLMKEFNSHDANAHKRMDDIINQLITMNDQDENRAGLLFLATHAAEGIYLVQKIRDAGLTNPIMVPDSFASQTFSQGFEKLPREKAMPGFYTNGIYCTSHLIFDTANEKAQHFKETYYQTFQEQPDWIAAYAYDTAMVIFQAMIKANIGRQALSIEEERERIQAELLQINSMDKAIEGVTGYIYFDEKGDAAEKPVIIGVYKNNNIISALTQLQAIRTPQDISNLKPDDQNERIIQIDDQLMFRTNVVYTGIELIEVLDFDPNTYTCDLDFYLWFRYQGDADISPQDIEFMNHVVLKGSSATTASQSNISESEDCLVKQSEPGMTIIHERSERLDNGIQYNLYRIKGKFRTDYFSESGIFEHHLLGVSFCHQSLSRNNLIYVIDTIGLGIAKKNIPFEKIKGIQIFTDKIGWTITEGVFYQDIVKKNVFGRSISVRSTPQTHYYSKFNFWVKLSKNTLTLRGMMPRKYAGNILLISALMSFFLLLAMERPPFKYLLRSLWLLQTLFLMTLLLSCEIVIIDGLMGRINPYHIKLIRLLFDMLWWIIPAYLLNLAIRRFIWIPLEDRAGHKIPNIIRRFVALFIYLCAVGGIVAFVFNQEMSKFLATGGLFAMIIGFAIQMNISNLISGIAINLENPFRIGDWIKIGDSEGKVVDITWRSTRIKTGENCILSIPNSTATESFISNYNYPDDLNWLIITVHVPPLYAPLRVKKILFDAILSTKGVLSDPTPRAAFSGLEDWAATYSVHFCVNDYANKKIDIENAWHRIWIHLRYADIPIAIQEPEYLMFEKEIEKTKNQPFHILNEMSIFQSLTDQAKMSLNEKMKRRIETASTQILIEGTPGDSIFLIQEGVVSVQITMDDGEIIEIERIGAGNFFGEIALMTGQYRSASIVALTDLVLYEIAKIDISPLIGDFPDLSKLIKETQIHRIQRLEKEKQMYQKRETESEILSIKLWDRIRQFFRIH